MTCERLAQATADDPAGRGNHRVLPMPISRDVFAVPDTHEHVPP
jgi:hypothetical protein